VSVAAVVARIQELERLAAGPMPAVAQGQFAAQLASASATPAAGAAAAVGAPAEGTATTGTTGTAPTSSTGAGLKAGTPYAAEISAAAAKHGVDPALLAGLVRQESNFNPNAKSPAGASGLTQLMPGTAAGLGVSDPTDPLQALDGGAKYLSQQLKAFDGDVARALAAYNAGPGAVQRFGGVPPYAETQNYVRKVQAYAAQYRA
jgi:soluble lytic murein transglycosylase-like protein